MCVVSYFLFVSSWLALRSQLKDPSYSEGTSALASTAPAVSSSLADSSALSEWCAGADDWGVEEGGEGEGGGGGEGSWGEGGEMGMEAKCGDHEEEKMEEEHLKQKAESGGYGGISVGLSEGTKLNELPPSSDTPACPMALACTMALVTSGTKCEESLGDAGTHSLADEVNALTLSSEQTESGHDLLAYQGPYFGSFYINVINEPSADEMMMEQVKELLQKYGKENVEELHDPRREDYERGGKRKPSGGGSGGAGGKRGADGGERYEKTVAKHGDRVFQKFHKVMSRCSNQILR